VDCIPVQSTQERNLRLFFSHNSSMHSSRLRFISSARDFLHEEKIKAKSHVSKLHFTYTDLDEQGVTQGSPLTHALFAVYRVFLKCVQKFLTTSYWLHVELGKFFFKNSVKNIYFFELHFFLNFCFLRSPTTS
jgi:hypothetical protein